ncbi:MAG TPA: hypothetical protein VGP05_24515 [Pseudonocardia sp.]|nr:hypothetical protein [Pseudonocardia sp.]
MKFSLVQVGLVTAIPYAVGAIVMILNALRNRALNTATGNFRSGMWVIPAAMAVAGVIVLTVGRGSARRPPGTQ